MADDILNQQEESTNPTAEEPAGDTPAPTIFDKVKLALRITHNMLDGEINDTIASARQELIRAGVDAGVANGTVGDEPIELVEAAIKTYALEYFTRDTKEAERYAESFRYQCDCLRKTYPGGEEDV